MKPCKVNLGSCFTVDVLSTEPEVELTPEEKEMMSVMGFAAFNTTKVS